MALHVGRKRVNVLHVLSYNFFLLEFSCAHACIFHANSIHVYAYAAWNNDKIVTFSIHLGSSCFLSHLICLFYHIVMMIRSNSNIASNSNENMILNFPSWWQYENDEGRKREREKTIIFCHVSFLITSWVYWCDYYFLLSKRQDEVSESNHPTNSNYWTVFPSFPASFTTFFSLINFHPFPLITSSSP